MATWSFASALAGAALGGLAAVTVQFLKYHIDGVIGRCTDLISALRSIADLSSEYWLTGFSVDVSATDTTVRDEAKKGRLLETKIRGLQKLVLSEVHALTAILPNSEAGELSKLQTKFIDAISGADFGDREGTINHTQAIAAHVVCNEMIHALQSAKASCVSVRYVGQRFIAHKLSLLSRARRLLEGGDRRK